jgi:hypothetical protein
LLCAGGRRNLFAVDEFNPENAMTNANPLIAGVAPALLAVAATVVSLLLLQFALLVA